MYVLVTAASRTPLTAVSTTSPMLNAPIRPATASVQMGRFVPARTRSSAANGRPNRLGCAHSTNVSSASPGRHHDSRLGGAFTLCGVTLDVRNQGQLPRALDRRRELPLVTRTHSRQPARQNLATLGQEAAQCPV